MKFKAKAEERIGGRFLWSFFLLLFCFHFNLHILSKNCGIQPVLVFFTEKGNIVDDKLYSKYHYTSLYNLIVLKFSLSLSLYIYTHKINVS